MLTLLGVAWNLAFVSPLAAQAESAPQEAEILIFSISSHTVTESAGTLKVQVSTFSPILAVRINGQPRKTRKGASLLWLPVPYRLTPGENFFKVEIETELGRAEETLTVVYDTPEMQRQAEAGDPFSLITILGYTASDNIDKAASGQARGDTTSVILVPTYRFDLLEDSSLSLSGILMADHQHHGEHKSKEILLGQFSVEWLEKNTRLGELSFKLGSNESGTWEVPHTSTPRHSFSKDYKQASREDSVTIKAKQATDLDTSWEQQLDLKQKDVAGSTDDDGLETHLQLAYVTPFSGIKTTLQGTLVNKDLKGQYDDAIDVKARIKLSYTWPLPLIMDTQYDFSQTNGNVTDPSLGGKLKTRNQSLSLGFNYPAFPWCILGLTQKQERQSSNESGKSYTVNTTQFQTILLY